MIRAEDAVCMARTMIGTPYEKMDCMALVIQVIRRSPGGIKNYRCQGTNWLWESIHGSGKYRHLTWRQEGIVGARAGMLAFKRYGMENEGHVGLVTGDGTVIHASSESGRAVETALTAEAGWDLLGIHRYIETEERQLNRRYRARITTKEDPLSLREAPKNGRVVARIPKDAIVDVLGEGEWPLIVWEGMQGYASQAYLERLEEETALGLCLVLTDDEGNTWIPRGGFTAQVRKTED